MANETRDLIVRTLRTRGKCTIKELAEAASVSPVSVRHHLSNLQVQCGVLYLSFAHHTELDDVEAKLRILNLAQRGADFLALLRVCRVNLP